MRLCHKSSWGVKYKRPAGNSAQVDVKLIQTNSREMNHKTDQDSPPLGASFRPTSICSRTGELNGSSHVTHRLRVPSGSSHAVPYAVWLAGTMLTCKLLLHRLPDSMKKPVSGGCRGRRHSVAHTAQPNHIRAAKGMRSNHPLRSLPRAPLLPSPLLSALSPAAPRFWDTAAQSGLLNDYS